MRIPPTSARALATVARAASSKVTAGELAAVRGALAKLPAADRALLVKHGLRVELVPRASLEDGMLGATAVMRGPDERLQPVRIRVASHVVGKGSDSLAEIVQHEVGHAISVLRSQDRSEEAAAQYARDH